MLSGAHATLEVEIPKKLRKAVRKEAKRRDLSIDQVVTDLLAEWLRR